MTPRRDPATALLALVLHGVACHRGGAWPVPSTPPIAPPPVTARRQDTRAEATRDFLGARLRLDLPPDARVHEAGETVVVEVGARRVALRWVGSVTATGDPVRAYRTFGDEQVRLDSRRSAVVRRTPAGASVAEFVLCGQVFEGRDVSEPHTEPEGLPWFLPLLAMARAAPALQAFLGCGEIPTLGETGETFHVPALSVARVVARRGGLALVTLRPCEGASRGDPLAVWSEAGYVGVLPVTSAAPLDRGVVCRVHLQPPRAVPDTATELDARDVLLVAPPCGPTSCAPGTACEAGRCVRAAPADVPGLPLDDHFLMLAPRRHTFDLDGDGRTDAIVRQNLAYSPSDEDFVLFVLVPALARWYYDPWGDFS